MIMPPPHPRAEGQEDDRLPSPAGAGPVLPEDRRVGVVFQVQGKAYFLRDPLQKGHMLPARQVRRRGHRSGAAVDDAGNAEGGSENLPSIVPKPPFNLQEAGGQSSDEVFRTVGGSCLLPVEIDDFGGGGDTGDPQVRPAQVETDDSPPVQG